MTPAELQALKDAQQKLDAKTAELAGREAEFAERDARLLADEAKLATEQQASEKRSLAEFCETLVKKGCLLPKDKTPAVEFMATLSDSAEIEFGEGEDKKKVASIAWFKSFLGELPKRIEFAELTPGEQDPEQAVQFASPAGYIAETDGLSKMQKIEQYQQQHEGCDIATAVNALNL